MGRRSFFYLDCNRLLRRITMTDYSNWKIEKSIINYIGDDKEKQQAAQTAQEERHIC